MDKPATYRARIGRVGDITTYFSDQFFETLEQATAWVIANIRPTEAYAAVYRLDEGMVGSAPEMVLDRKGVRRESPVIVGADFASHHTDAIRYAFSPARNSGKSWVADFLRGDLWPVQGRRGQDIDRVWIDEMPDPPKRTKAQKAARRARALAARLGYSVAFMDTSRGVEVMLQRTGSAPYGAEPMRKFVGWRKALKFLQEQCAPSSHDAWAASVLEVARGVKYDWGRGAVGGSDHVGAVRGSGGGGGGSGGGLAYTGQTGGASGGGGNGGGAASPNLSDVLRARGRNNTLHDINRAADEIDRLTAFLAKATGKS